MKRRLAMFFLGVMTGVAASMVAESATHEICRRYVWMIQAERARSFRSGADRYLEWTKKTVGVPIEIGSFILFPKDKVLPVGWIDCNGTTVSMERRELGPKDRIRALVGNVTVAGRKAMIQTPLLAAPSGTSLRWIVYVGKLDD